MHLGDAHPLGDLALGQVLGETQVQNRAVALGDLGEGALDRGPVLDGLEADVHAADASRSGPASPSLIVGEASSETA